MFKRYCFASLFFFFNTATAAIEKKSSNFTHQPHMQISALSYESQFIFANSNDNSGNTEQIYTTRPTLAFYLPFYSYVFRPTLSLNPYNSSSSGSFAAGYQWADFFEGGLFLKLNRDVNSYGEGDQKNETIESDFLIGPYIYLTPYADETRAIEWSLRATYLYQDKKNTTGGATTIMTEKRGAQVSTQISYVQKIKENIFISPNVSFSYAFTNDTGAQNKIENTVGINLEALSFRILL